MFGDGQACWQFIYFFKKYIGVPGWFGCSWSLCLQLMSWSPCSGIKPISIGSLFPARAFSCYLCHYLCFSQINKNFSKMFIKGLICTNTFPSSPDTHEGCVCVCGGVYREIFKYEPVHHGAQRPCLILPERHERGRRGLLGKLRNWTEY